MTMAALTAPRSRSRIASASERCPRLHAEGLRRLELAHEAARQGGVGRVDHGGRDVAHVEVDGVAEERELERRDADDHAEREPIASQLSQLLARDRGHASERAHEARSGAHASPPAPVSSRSPRSRATNTSSSVAGAGAAVAPPRPASARSWTSAGAAALAAGASGARSTWTASPSWVVLATSELACSAAMAAAAGSTWSSTVAAGERARQSGRLADGDAPAVAQHAEAVTAHGLVHVVRRDEDRRPAPGEAEELLPELAPALRVDARRRLVEHQQLGLVDGGRREREPLLPPARERPGPRAAVGDEPGVVEHRREPGAPATPPEPEDLGGEVEVLLDREILVEREVLGHVADRGAQALGVARHAVAEHLRRAGGRLEEPHQHAHERRLARAVRPEAAEDLAPPHGEVDAVDGDARAEAAREPAGQDRDRGCVGGHDGSQRHEHLRRLAGSQRRRGVGDLDARLVDEVHALPLGERVVRGVRRLARDLDHPAGELPIETVDSHPHGGAETDVRQRSGREPDAHPRRAVGHDHGHDGAGRHPLAGVERQLIHDAGGRRDQPQLVETVARAGQLRLRLPEPRRRLVAGASSGVEVMGRRHALPMQGQAAGQVVRGHGRRAPRTRDGGLRPGQVGPGKRGIELHHERVPLDSRSALDGEGLDRLRDRRHQLDQRALDRADQHEIGLAVPASRPEQRHGQESLRVRPAARPPLCPGLHPAPERAPRVPRRILALEAVSVGSGGRVPRWRSRR